MEYPAALMMAGSPKLRSDSETRRSIVSSGIGPDSSPRSSLSCSDFSPCPSVSSLDEPPDYSPSDEPYDVESLPEDDASQLSSGGDVEELNANTTTDSLTDHTPNHVLTIRTSHGLPRPRLAENFKRTRSMNIDALSWATNQDTKDVRSMSMDERYETPSPKPTFQPWNENVTVIKINPGYEPEIFPNLTFDNHSLPCLTEDEIKPNTMNLCYNRFPTNNNKNTPNFNYASDENRNVKVDMNKVRVESYLNLASQNNNESNPGYIKFIDDQTTDPTSSSPDDTSLDIDKVKVNVIANPVYENGVKFVGANATENGVKFLDEQEGAGDGDSICSSGDCFEEEEEYKRKSKVPDGGWGWVIVAASFVISMIADGISFSFGLLYIEFLRHFGESSSQTSLVGSLFMAIPLLSGPIGSALVDRYGCRIMTMIGGFVAGLGFVASAFANSLGTMYVTFGLVAGVGLGLCYVTAVVSIAYWFDRRRTLATGLGACGTGFGTVLFAHMTSYFIAEYGWRGCTLLLAGTFFNMCVCGALMRDPQWWAEQNKAASVAGTKSVRGASSCGSMSGLVEDFPGVEELKRRLKSGEESEYTVTNLATSTGGDPSGDVNQNYTFRSVVNLPTFVRQSEKVPLEVLESLSANRRVFNVILENYPTLLLSRSSSDGSKLNATPRNEAAPLRVPVSVSMRVTQSSRATPPMENSTPVSPDMSITPLIRQHSLSSQQEQTGVYGSIVPWRDDKAATRIEQAATRIEHKVGMFGCVMPKTPPQKEKSVFNKKNVERADSLQALKKHVSTVPSTHYLKNIRLHRNSVMYRGAMLNIHRYRLRASSCPDIYRNSMTTIAKENQEKWYADLVELIRGILDFSMFQELHFLLMSIATILLFIWFIVPYFYLADHALLNNYSDSEVSSLLMIIGVTNFFGMVGLGWAGDQPWMNVTKTYAMCMVICGLATMAMPYFTYSYWLLASSCAVFGLFFASSFSFTPVILAQLIPIERFTTAYGLSLMCQGIGNLIGPPLAGWFFDMTRTYDISFYMAGVWIIVAGILLAIIPMTTNRRIWGNGPIEKDKASLSDNRDSSYT